MRKSGHEIEDAVNICSRLTNAPVESSEWAVYFRRISEAKGVTDLRLWETNSNEGHSAQARGRTQQGDRT